MPDHGQGKGKKKQCIFVIHKWPLLNSVTYKCHILIHLLFVSLFLSLHANIEIRLKLIYIYFFLVSNLVGQEEFNLYQTSF